MRRGFWMMLNALSNEKKYIYKVKEEEKCIFDFIIFARPVGSHKIDYLCAFRGLWQILPAAAAYTLFKWLFH
jgi:hypothetical protein